MARNQEVVEVPFREWRELTNSDVTELTFQVLEGHVEIRRATDVQPDGTARGFHYGQHLGERAVTPDELSAAGTGARIWAFGTSHTPSKVIVDHA